MNVFMVLFGLFLLIVLIAEKGAGENECRDTRCEENGPPIRFPFRLKDSQPAHCGYPGFDVTCTSSNETALVLPNVQMRFLVKQIDYKYQQMDVYSPDECGFQKQNLESLSVLISPFHFSSYEIGTTLFNCALNHTFGSWDVYRRIPCLSDHKHVVRIDYSDSDLSYDFHELVSCRKMTISPVPPSIFKTDYRTLLTWSKPSCQHCEAKGTRCRLKMKGTEIDEIECVTTSKEWKGAMLIAVIVLSSLALIPLAIAIFRVYATNKNERESSLRIKKFLEDYQAFQPTRLTYRDIKKITNQFKEKLGEGAYGTVFKGKLSNEVLVAVKILNNFKGNGEEFINEVATIGRIHHVNVVRLVGYCAEGFRRALIYEFLPNDSLDKHISSVAGGRTNHSLSLETLQDIAIGIAKGIEYLHLGCDQRILHFDIKPQNILLDHNFTPKISDFGLAKLCSKDQSLVSMSTARGTMGYIAPEVFSRNFGNVSYKSDVYSFGMLLLEMVGGRKSTNVTKENTDEIYYPEWIYNLLEEGDDLRIHIEEEGDARIAKKLAIGGLWCIQWHPVGRPTMKAVVRMLEAGEELTMPPNPFASVGPSNTNNNKMPTRSMALELEAIAE